MKAGAHVIDKNGAGYIVRAVNPNGMAVIVSDDDGEEWVVAVEDVREWYDIWSDKVQMGRPVQWVDRGQIRAGFMLRRHVNYTGHVFAVSGLDENGQPMLETIIESEKMVNGRVHRYWRKF